jgi:hypothetical protein
MVELQRVRAMLFNGSEVVIELTGLGAIDPQLLHDMERAVNAAGKPLRMHVIEHKPTPLEMNDAVLRVLCDKAPSNGIRSAVWAIAGTAGLDEAETIRALSALAKKGLADVEKGWAVATVKGERQSRRLRAT